MRPKFSFADRPFWIAFSGGKDSLAVAHWVKTKRKYKDNFLGLAHFHHGLGPDDEIYNLAMRAAKKLNVSVAHGKAKGSCPRGESIEAWCRDQRYAWFDEMQSNFVMAHHLGDAVEQYIMNCLRGCPEHRPIQESVGRTGNTNIIRPFITTSPSDIRAYVKRFKLGKYIAKDPMNNDLSRMRNWIRHDIAPQLQDRVGLEKIVRKKFYK